MEVDLDIPRIYLTSILTIVSTSEVKILISLSLFICQDRSLRFEMKIHVDIPETDLTLEVNFFKKIQEGAMGPALII